MTEPPPPPVPQVVARDRGSPPQSAVGLVEIIVGQQRDQTTLQFQNDTYTAWVPENAQTGSDVIQVRRDVIGRV